MELYPHRHVLEIWTAPGDSELEVAYNRPSSIVFTKMSQEECVVKNKGIKTAMVGFQGEMYEQGEEGF